MLAAGSLIPAHLRSLDRDVLVASASGSPSLLVEADRAVVEDKVGPARLLLTTARTFAAGEADQRLARIAEVERLRPALRRWGGRSEFLDRTLGALVLQPETGSWPVLDWLLPETVRQTLWAPLQGSLEPGVMALLTCRRLETTSVLPPVSSASGQPLDAALVLAATLLDQHRMHPVLAIELERAAMAAVQGRGTLAVETALVDLLAASRHLDWNQLAELTSRCEGTGALHALVAAAGMEGERWGPLFSATMLNNGGRAVASFLERHSETGLEDLNLAISLGQSAVQLLVQRGDPVHQPRLRQGLVRMLRLERPADWVSRATVRAPWLAMVAKLLLWGDGLFLLATGLWYMRRCTLNPASQRLYPRPDPRMMAIVTAAGLVFLFLGSERLLPQKSTTPQANPSRLFPMVTARLSFDAAQLTTPAMNDKILAMLVAFFVLQLALYLVGLGRLRQIRGQLVDGSVKLKLLDNEESMFDAPLYLGIGGSVLALVMRLTGFDEISLMASYSSTLFGILFCFMLKVMHVRPYRQRLILESADEREGT